MQTIPKSAIFSDGWPNFITWLRCQRRDCHMSLIEASICSTFDLAAWSSTWTAQQWMLAFCAKKMHLFFNKKNYIHVNDFRVETTTAKQLSMNKVIILSYQYLVKPPQKKYWDRSRSAVSVLECLQGMKHGWFSNKKYGNLAEIPPTKPRKAPKTKPLQQMRVKTTPSSFIHPQKKAGEGCLPKTHQLFGVNLFLSF